MNHNRKAFFNSGTKWIAGLTATLFAVVNTALAQPQPLSADAIKESASLSTLANLQLPESLGGIESTFRAGRSDAPFVAVIQDAHAVLDAQTNIQEIIKYLQAQYGIRLITVEGGSGRLDPTLFRAFPDPFVKKKIFADYVKHGELTGAESAAVMNSEEAQYYGIEDWKLYEKHYVAYLRAAEKTESVLKHLGTLRSRLDQERLKVYSPKVNQFHENLEKFEKVNVYLLELLNFLGTIDGTRQRIARFPNLEKLFRSYDFEKDTAQDKSTLEARIRQMAEAFKMNYLKRMNIKQEMIFHQNYQAFTTGQTEDAVFLKYLIETGESFGVKARLSPSLLKILGHHETLATIKGTKLFEELQNLIAETEEALITGPEEKELAEKYRRLKLLADLAKLELTRSQFDEYQKAPEMYASTLTQALSPEGRGKDEGAKLLGPAIEFYRLALERDQAFRRNLTQLLKEQKANAVIVVAGGFHTQGFEKSLKEQGLSFSIITPKIQSLEGQETYTSVMQGNLSYKPYLRTTFYDAFARDSSMKLANEFSEPDFRKNMKLWRDEVIRKLSSEGKLAKAGEYTRYIDLIYEVYHEKFGQGNRTAKSREEILQAIDQELKDFTDESVGRQWQKLEWQINQLGAGLKSLVAQKDLRFDRIAALVNQVRLTQPATLGPVLKLNPQSPSISEMSPVIKTLILEGKLIPEADRIPLIPAAKAVLPIAVNNRVTSQLKQKTAPVFANENKIRLGKMDITQGELTAVRSEVRAFDTDPEVQRLAALAAKGQPPPQHPIYGDIAFFARRVSQFYESNKIVPESKMNYREAVEPPKKLSILLLRSILTNAHSDLYAILKANSDLALKAQIDPLIAEKRDLDATLNAVDMMGSTVADALDSTKVDKRKTRPGQTKPVKSASERAKELLKGKRTASLKPTEPAKPPRKVAVPETKDVYSLAPVEEHRPSVQIEVPEEELRSPTLAPTTIDIVPEAEEPGSEIELSEEQVTTLKEQIGTFLTSLTGFLAAIKDKDPQKKHPLKQKMEANAQSIQLYVDQLGKEDVSIAAMLDLIGMRLTESETDLEQARANLEAKQQKTPAIQQGLERIADLIGSNRNLLSAVLNNLAAPQQPETLVEPPTEPEPAPEEEVGLKALDTDEKQPVVTVKEETPSPEPSQTTEEEHTSMIIGTGEDQTEEEAEARMREIEDEDTELEPKEPPQEPEKPEVSEASEALKGTVVTSKPKPVKIPAATFTLGFLDKFRSGLIEDLDKRDTAIIDKILNRNQFAKGYPRAVAFGFMVLMAAGVFAGVGLAAMMITGLLPHSVAIGGISGFVFGIIIGFFVWPDLSINKYRKAAKEDFGLFLKEQSEGLTKLYSMAKEDARDKNERLVFIYVFTELGKRFKIAVSWELGQNPTEDLKKTRKELNEQLAELKTLKESIEKVPPKPTRGGIELVYPVPQQRVYDADILWSIAFAVFLGLPGAIFLVYLTHNYFVPAMGIFGLTVAIFSIFEMVKTIASGIRDNKARIAAQASRTTTTKPSASEPAPAAVKPPKVDPAAARQKESDAIKAEYRKIQSELNNNAVLQTVLKAGIQGQPGEKLAEVRTILEEARSRIGELEMRGQKVGMSAAEGVAKIEDRIRRINLELATQGKVIVEIMNFANRLKLNGKPLPDKFMYYVLDSMIKSAEGEIDQVMLPPKYAKTMTQTMKLFDDALRKIGRTRKEAIEPLKVLLGTYASPRSEVRTSFNFSDDEIEALGSRLNVNPEVKIIVDELNREYRGRLDQAKNRLGENRKAILTTIREASDIVAEVFSEKFKKRITDELGWTVAAGLLQKTDLDAVLWRVRAVAVGEAIAAITEADLELARAVEGISDAALEAFQKQIRDALASLKTNTSSPGLNIVIVKPDNPADAAYVELALSLLREFIDTAEILYASDQKPENGLRHLGFPVIQHRYKRLNFQRDVHEINEEHQRRNGRFPDWLVTNGLQLPEDLRRLLTSLQARLDLMPEKLKGPFVSAASALFKALNDLSEDQRRVILNDPTGEKLREFIEEYNLGFPDAFGMSDGVIIPVISGLIRDIKAFQAAAQAA